jgi:hypothetical protein
MRACRYSKARDLGDLKRLFGYDKGTISKFLDYLEAHIERHASPHLKQFHPALVVKQELHYYARCIAARGCPIPNVWAFLDGFRIHVCRPGGHPSHQVTH